MAILINNLTFSYTKTTPILQDFSLTLEKGEIVALIGASGIGKTTLLYLLTGILHPTSGSITIDEKPIVSKTTFLTPDKRNIGLLFQDYALFPHMTVEKNIAFGIATIKKEEKKAKVSEMLRLVNLEGLEKRYPHELSGGQQQRVALARALAPSPSLLLLDEPFSSVDQHLKTTIRTELKTILKKTNTSSILVTHDISDANAIADRIIAL